MIVTLYDYLNSKAERRRRYSSFVADSVATWNAAATTVGLLLSEPRRKKFFYVFNVFIIIFL